MQAIVGAAGLALTNVQTRDSAVLDRANLKNIARVKRRGPHRQRDLLGAGTESEITNSSPRRLRRAGPEPNGV